MINIPVTLTFYKRIKKVTEQLDVTPAEFIEILFTEYNSAKAVKERVRGKNVKGILPYPAPDDFVVAQGQIWVKFNRTGYAAGYHNNTRNYDRAFRKACSKRNHGAEFILPSALLKKMPQDPKLVDASHARAFLFMSAERFGSGKSTALHTVVAAFDQMVTMVQMMRRLYPDDGFASLSYEEQQQKLWSFLDNEDLTHSLEHVKIPYDFNPNNRTWEVKTQVIEAPYAWGGRITGEREPDEDPPPRPGALARHLGVIDDEPEFPLESEEDRRYFERDTHIDRDDRDEYGFRVMPGRKATP